MVGKNLISIFVICAMLGCGVLVADEPKLKERRFGNCFLHETEGRVWLCQPMVYLGMYGVAEMPSFCLSQDLAKKLAPLVSNIVTENIARPCVFYFDWMPRLRDGKGSLVLLGLQTKMRPLEIDTSMMDGSHSPAVNTYEIASARLTAVECVRGEWIQGWQVLNKALNEIVSTSLTPPGDTKRKSLTQAIEKGSQILNTMAKVKVSDDFRALVSKIEPEARLVRGFQQRVAGRWQRELEKYAARLRIKPQTPLPEGSRKCPALELLAESKSPAEFISKIKRSWPANVLKQKLIHSSHLRRTIRVRDVEHLTDAEFEKIHAEAAKVLAERQERANKQVEQWGVVLRRAPTDLLADKLILRGALVEKVLTDQPEIGLKPRDIIIDYEGVYDVVMGDLDFTRSMQQLANRVRHGRKLRVLRGEQVITIAVKNKL